MRWWLPGFAFVAACSAEPGVDLTVRTEGVTFDSVELYVAKDACDTCADGVGWPMTPQKVPGEVWLIEGDELVVRSDVLADGAGVIHLQAAPGFDQPKAIAIVAFNGGQVVAATVLHEKAIPLDRQESWTVMLHLTDPASIPGGQPTSDQSDTRAVAWAREAGPAVADPTGYAGCFAYQAWDGATWNTEYFVPATDPDCDGAPPDCDPYWNHAPTKSPPCVTRPQPLPTVCALGKKTCTTEDASTCGAAAPLTCVPDAWCSCGPDNVRTCIKDQFLDPVQTNLPFALCPFTIDPNNTNSGCTIGGVGQNLVFTVPGMCAAPLATQIAGLRPEPFAADAPSLNLSGGATITVHGQLTTSSGVACVITLQWTHSTSVGNPTPVYVSIWMTDRQVLIPVWITFVQAMTCPTNTLQCERDGAWPEPATGLEGDTLFQCTR